jgi:predicted PurR-regulated permease PerM
MIFHKISSFAAFALNNPFTLGLLTFLLVMVPIVGISVVHNGTQNDRH